MLLATSPCLLQDAQQTFTVQNKPAAVAPKETITHHFFVSGSGQKKTVDAAKICGGAENVVKAETQQTFVMDCSVYYFRHLYSAGSACVLLTIIAVAIDMVALSALLINILLGSFQLFCIVVSLSLKIDEEIIHSAVSVIGRAIIHARRCSRTDWQTALIMQPTTTSGNVHAEHHFQHFIS